MNKKCIILLDVIFWVIAIIIIAIISLAVFLPLVILHKCESDKCKHGTPRTFGFTIFDDGNSTLEDTERRNSSILKNDSS